MSEGKKNAIFLILLQFCIYIYLEYLIIICI